LSVDFIRVLLMVGLYPGNNASIMQTPHTYTCFVGHRRLATGPLAAIALAVKRLPAANEPVLVFDDLGGRTLDLDLRGSEKDVQARYAPTPSAAADEPSAEPQAGDAEGRGRGRPKLGVVAKEVTLLPRHWEWLAEQPGGASVTLRRLVEEARRGSGERDRLRKAHERAYHFMSAMAGNMPAFEEASRALFANESERFRDLVAPWPKDIREHACRLGFEAGTSGA
jgi:hypothetical protein